MLEHIARTAKSKGIKNLDVKIDSAFEQMKDMQKEIAELKNQISALKSKEWITEAEDINGLHVLTKRADSMDGKALKEIAASLKGNDPKLAALFISENNGKLTLVAAAGSEAIAKGINAGKIVKEAAAATGGKGGGKPDLAQAGGADASRIPAAFDVLIQAVKAA